MEDVLDTIRSFFEERNRVWVIGDIRPLAWVSQAATTDAWYRGFRLQLAAKRREMSARGGKLLRSHSKIEVSGLTREDDGRKVWVNVQERVTWVYQGGHDYTVESRLVRHRQQWAWNQKNWVLQLDLESGEGQQPQSQSISDRARRLLTPRTAQVPVRSGTNYDRLRVLRYAELWWDGFNPSFVRFEADDCTNFISQCLLAGNLQMTDGGNRAVGWWYRFAKEGREAAWSYSWSTANGLALWLTNRAGAQVIKNARDLLIGDVIFYDWQGNGKFGHSTVVVDFDAAGNPLVNAHTDPSYHRHYQYLDSRAWTTKTKYQFVHLPDNPP